jgi:hypothetical protein
MFGIHIISVYLLSIGLLVLLAAVLLLQRQRSGKTLVVWLSSALVGMLLGSVGTVAIVCLAGYEVHVSPRLPDVPLSDVEGESSEDEMEEMGEGMAGMGGPPGMGGPRQPRPKRDLTNLVRKIELLTGDVGITLSDEQATALSTALADVEKAETMSDDDAQAKHDELLELLDDEQEARLEAIDLPRRRGGGRGGPGGGPGGPGGGGPAGPGGPGGGPPDEDANPFQQEPNAEALTRLRERFGAEQE